MQWKIWSVYSNDFGGGVRSVDEEFGGRVDKRFLCTDFPTTANRKLGRKGVIMGDMHDLDKVVLKNG